MLQDPPYTWEDVTRIAISDGFKRAEWGSRLEGYTFVMSDEGGGVVKLNNSTLPSFETTMSYKETVNWLARNTWED